MRPIIVAFLAIAITACQQREPEENNTLVLCTTPLMCDTTLTREYVAQIKAYQHIELRALERGYLQEIHVDEGQWISKGQLMFRLTPTLYEAELKKSEAEKQYAQIEYENTRKLADRNIVSPNELALAKANLDKAKAEMSLAETHLKFTEIRAPFNGIMDHFYVRLGSLLEEGDLLTTISDNSKLWVYFNVPESEYLNYRMQHEDRPSAVRLQLANGKIFQPTGKIETIEAEFNNETGNIAFRASFNNPEKILRHGETGTILLESFISDAILIPQKATYEVLEKKYVFVIDPAGTVHSREIKIDAELPDLYVIQSGLKPSENIVLEGIRKIKDGQKVSSKFLKPSEVYRNLKVYSE